MRSSSIPLDPELENLWSEARDHFARALREESGVLKKPLFRKLSQEMQEIVGTAGAEYGRRYIDSSDPERHKLDFVRVFYGIPEERAHDFVSFMERALGVASIFEEQQIELREFL